MNQITLTIGDYSSDGHGKTVVSVIETNLTKEELQEAYKKGCKIIGEDIVENVCSDLEDHDMDKILFDKIIEGESSTTDPRFTMQNMLEEYDEEPNIVAVNQHGWHILYLFVARKGNPELTFKIIPNKYCNIDIGGYGLFYG